MAVSSMTLRLTQVVDSDIRQSLKSDRGENSRIRVSTGHQNDKWITRKLPRSLVYEIDKYIQKQKSDGDYYYDNSTDFIRRAVIEKFKRVTHDYKNNNSMGAKVTQ